MPLFRGSIDSARIPFIALLSGCFCLTLLEYHIWHHWSPLFGSGIHLREEMYEFGDFIVDEFDSELFRLC
jgi:hypothetical protein